MGIDQVVVGAVLIIAVFSVFVLCVELILPMFVKLAFDEICRDYLLIAEMNNGLSAEDRAELRERIAALGAEQIDIVASARGEARRGEPIRLSVRAELRQVRIAALFGRGETVCVLRCDRQLIARRIAE